MPPKIKINRDDILEAAVDIVRAHGDMAMNARSIAAQLGCSTQPIFTNFGTMDELRRGVIAVADGLFRDYIKVETEKREYVPYKAVGMAYIRFAKEERELFKLLFMRDRSAEKSDGVGTQVEEMTSVIQKSTGLSKEDALLLHLEMWVCVHGIAAMVATGYLEWSTELVSSMLTDCFDGLKRRFQDKEKGRMK